jgi:hypothetical protein
MAGGGAKASLGDPFVACVGVLRGSPGPRSAGVLAAWSYLPGDVPERPSGPLSEVVDVVMAGRRLEAWALWVQLSSIARLLVAWAVRPPLGDMVHPSCEAEDPALARRLTDVSNRELAALPKITALTGDEKLLTPAFVAAEIALACGLSQRRAAERVVVAEALFVQSRHPRVAALAHAGLLEWSKLHLLVVSLNRLEPAAAEAVERLLIPDADLAVAHAAAEGAELDVRADPEHPGGNLPRVSSWVFPRLQREIAAAIAVVDRDAAAERAARARAERAVTATPEDDGTARLSARGPAEAVAAVMTDLDAVAAAAKAAGDSRTLDQVRADEFFHRLTNGRYGASAGRSRDIARLAGGGDEGGECSCSGWTKAGPRVGLQISLTMPLTTWLGLAADPGQLAGYGPITAALARQMAADAARDNPATTTWRCVVTDDEHRTVVGVGRPVSTPRHDPPVRLAAFVAAAEPTCVFPGCDIPVKRCDIDHRISYPDGATCSCNLQPLCRTHHRLKTSNHLAVRLLQPGEDPTAPPGTLEWKTRAGFTYRREPSVPVPPALWSALPDAWDLPARLADCRHAEAAELRAMNGDLMTAQARRVNAGYDARAADARAAADAPARAALAGVLSETIEHPPAVLDDDPAPAQPVRPLETSPWEPAAALGLTA